MAFAGKGFFFYHHLHMPTLNNSLSRRRVYQANLTEQLVLSQHHKSPDRFPDDKVFSCYRFFLCGQKKLTRWAKSQCKVAASSSSSAARLARVMVDRTPWNQSESRNIVTHRQMFSSSSCHPVRARQLIILLCARHLFLSTITGSRN